MAKIRDLGINVIPVTMRPLEIGPGAAQHRDGTLPFGYFACYESSQCVKCECPNGSSAEESSCNPSGGDCMAASGKEECPGQGASAKPRKYYAGAFTDDAVTQLKRQLRTRIGKELEH